MNILLSAFACDPDYGSDEEVGWRWAVELARLGHHVTVVTRTSHRESVERGLQQLAPMQRPEFLFVDLPRLHRLMAKINRRNHIYYYFWQVAAALAVWRSGRRYDVAQHVTWVSLRQPSFMGFFAPRFIFGPVAGGDSIPIRLLSSLGTREAIYELIRWLANASNRINPLMYLTFAMADEVIVTSDSCRQFVPGRFHHKTRTKLAIGVDSPQLHEAIKREAVDNEGPLRLLYVGRVLGLKGIQLVLPAIRCAKDAGISVNLTVVGSGNYERVLRNQANSIGVDDAVTWVGWVNKNDLPTWYRNHDILVYPSLRDSGGLAVLEAMEHGLPVIALTLGGPGLIVGGGGGIAVSTDGRTTTQVSDGIFEAIRACAESPRYFQDLRSQALQRSRDFSWSALVGSVHKEAAHA